MKKILCLAIAVMVLCLNSGICASEEVYRIYDSTVDGEVLVEEMASFSSALSRYRALSDEYHNLVLAKDDTVIAMEYGIVEIKSDDSCSVDLTYRSSDGKQKVINGCYGADAAYISSSYDLSEVTFMISGDVGTADLSEVILHPYESLEVAPSLYRVQNGSLYHDIKSQLREDYVFNSIEIDVAPSYLSYGQTYFSYDGHYFYRSFYDMIDDYRSEYHNRSVNQKNPYYNYYMYLSHRSLTNYSYKDLEEYFSDTLVFNKRLDTYYDFNYDGANDDVNRSQYVGTVSAFFENEYRYGANAMMMLSLSIYESSYGKSYASFAQNNLFGHAAYDNQEEIGLGRYKSVARSIYSHAKYYISSRFANPQSGTYNGSFFGDMASGMNVNYSKDPYWGENLASDYYSFDRALGYNDHNSYCIGIITTSDDIKVYEDPGLTELKAEIKDIVPYAFIILEEEDGYYKVQYDGCSDQENYYYDYQNDIGYIAKDIVDHLLNKEAIKEDKYHTVTFDTGDKKISYKIAEGEIPTIEEPYKEGYMFVGYDKEPAPIYEDTTYVCEYLKIISIELTSLPKTTLELDGIMSLEGGMLRVVYEDKDGTRQDMSVELTSDMVTNYDLSKEGKQTIIVSYCGMVTSYEIEVSKELADLRDYLDQTLPSIMTRLKNGEEVSSDEVLAIKDAVLETNYILDNDVIILLDQVLLKEYRQHVNFHIGGLRDIAISGMGLSLDIGDDYQNSLKIIPDTYYLYSGVSSLDESTYLAKISAAYGFERITSFSISFKKNDVNIKNNGPFIIEIPFEDIDTHKIYTVYNVDENGDVIKCRTMQSQNGIQFTTMGDGEFMILALDTTNDYAIDDPTIFNITTSNDDIDMMKVIYIGGTYAFFLLWMVIVFVYHRVKEKKTKEIWSDYKKSWRAQVSPQEEKLKS